MAKFKLLSRISLVVLCLTSLVASADLQKINESRNATFKEIDGSILNVVQIVGSQGIALVEVKFKGSKPALTFECNPINRVWCLLPRSNKSDNEESLTMDVTVSCHAGTCDLSAELLAEDQLKYDSGERYLELVTGDESADVSFEVSPSKLFGKDVSSKDKKLRFITSGGNRDKYLPGYFEGNNVFKMEIKHKKSNQPRNSATSIARKITELGPSLVSTIYPNDKDFCTDDSCAYVVRITATKMTLILFSLEAIDMIKEIQASTDVQTSYNSIWLEGQTYSDQPETYKFKVNTTGDLTFELTAWEGNPDIFINIDDIKGYDTSKYYYKSEHDAPETILITKQELDDSPGGGKEVHVVIKSSSVAGFYLSATWSNYKQFDKATPIKLNSFYSGALHDKEVASFVLSFNPQIQEVASGYVSLKAVTGNPDLYIKDCDNEDSCYFTLDEIEKLVSTKNNNSDSSETYFIYSNDPLKSDNLYYEMMVSPPGTNNSLPDSSDIGSSSDNNMYVSRFNKICIGVVGSKTTFSEISQYSLMVSGRGSHRVIKEYQTEYFYLESKDTIYCVFKPLKLPDQAKGIIIKFEVSGGDVDFHYSKLSRYPSELVSDEDLIIDNDQSAFESTLKSFKVSKDDLNNEGVYFAFVTKKQTLIKLEVVYWLPDTQPKSGLIELIPNAPVVRNIKQVSDFIIPSKESDTFTFKTTEIKDHIFIKMKPLFSGGYHDLIFCAGKLKKDPDTLTSEDCDFFGKGGLITLEPTRAKNETVWFVLVKHSKESEKIEQIRLAYEITLLGPGTISELKHMGVSEEFALPAGLKNGENMHYVEFVSQSRDKYYYLVAQSLNGQPFKLQMTFDESGLDWNQGVYGYDGFSDTSNTFTIPFKETEIRKNCEPMIADEGPGDRRLQEDKKEVDDDPYDGRNDPKAHGEIAMALKCKGFIRVSNSIGNSGSELPYRLLFAELNTKIELLAGRTYKLPKPGKNALYMKVPVGSLPNGATISVSGVYEPSEASASIVSASLKDKNDIYNGSVSLLSGYGRYNLEIEPSTFDHEKLKQDNRENYIDIMYTVQHEKDDYEFNDDGSMTPLIISEYFLVSVSTSTTDITLDQTISGRVSYGNTRYYKLEVDSSVDVTLTLHTRGRQDADLFVKLPGRVEYIAQSTNYRSDEIFLPRKSSERGEMITYIIGVTGSSPVCEFSLTAIDNSFKVVSPDFSRIYSYAISEESPVVIRSEWAFYGGVRVFYYSFDTDIALHVGVEGKDGILEAIKKSKLEAPVAWNDEVGLSAKYMPNKGGISDDWTGKFFAFYPSTSTHGSVSFVVNHPNIPIKVKPGDAQLKIVLNRGESILIEPYVDRGELSSIVVGIGGTSGFTSFTYNTK